MLKKNIINRKNILKIVLCLFIFLTSNKSSAAVLSTGNISTCGELASPGTYTLTQNISGGNETCFYISSDNVTINGGGFTITGTGAVAIDARARTGGPTGSLTDGAHAYTNLIINDLNISGYITGINMSGNDDLVGTGVNNGNGGDGGDIVAYYSYLGSIIIDGGDSSSYPTGGLGGNMAINDTDLNISNSVFSSAGGLGILGYGSNGNLILNYTGALNKNSVSFSKLSLLKDNNSEYVNYPGGTWPISPGNISSCGTLYGAGIYTLTQDLVSSSTCFIIGSDDITIDGSGHSLISATTTSSFAIDSPSSDNTNLVVKNLSFSNFSNTITSTSSLSITNSGDVNLSNQTINAGSLIIKYIGNFIYSNTILSNLTSLIINSVNYQDYTSGPLSSFANSWTEKTSVGTKAWTSVASSIDGKYVYATVDVNNYLYTSSDYGKTWNNNTALGGNYWGFVETSYDGKYIIVLKSNSA